MKAQSEPFAECPCCNAFTLQVATEQEKLAVTEELEWNWAHTSAPPETYYLLVCSICGYFDTISCYSWGEWYQEMLEKLNKLHGGE